MVLLLPYHCHYVIITVISSLSPFYSQYFTCMGCCVTATERSSRVMAERERVLAARARDNAVLFSTSNYVPAAVHVDRNPYLMDLPPPGVEVSVSVIEL